MINSYLQLLRFPGIFSAMSNSYAGWILGGGAFFSSGLWWAMAASGLFLLGGMGLNDYADRDVDARERPSRPIPSRRVTAERALFLSWTLLCIGVGLSFMAGWAAGFLSLLLVFFIAGYNFWGKNTPVGIFAMGGCRAINIALGYFFALGYGTTGSFGLLLLGAFFLFVYVALLSYLAKKEVEGTGVRPLILFLVGYIVFILGWLLALTKIQDSSRVLGILFLVLLSFVFWKPLYQAFQRPDGPSIRAAVVAALTFMPICDALILAAAGKPVFQLLVPFALVGFTIFTGKKLYQT